MQDTKVLQLPRDEVLDAVRAIVDAFEAGDPEQVQAALARLGAPTNDALYKKLGTMTRSLHTSIEEFKQSLNRDNLNMSTTNIPDAADKLEAVIQMTLNAANTTLACTEQNTNSLTTLRESVEKMKSLCASQKWNTVETRVSLIASLDTALREIEIAEDANNNILMAQAFQDLTGQAIRKVITLVGHLESQLVELIKVFGHQVEHRQADAPPVPADPTATSIGKLEQDDADAVLKQFGF